MSKLRHGDLVTFLTGAIFALLLGSASVAKACIASPGLPLDIDAAYRTYDAIFVGEVVDWTPIDSSWRRVTIRIDERLKRDVGKHVSVAVYTRMDCNPQTAIGTRYIFFAVKKPAKLPPAPKVIENDNRPPLDMNSIAQIRGQEFPSAPPVPWDGDFILQLTAVVDVTSTPYAERVKSALAKLRAQRADDKKE
jgi:hypothetical protein